MHGDTKEKPENHQKVFWWGDVDTRTHRSHRPLATHTWNSARARYHTRTQPHTGTHSASNAIDDWRAYTKNEREKCDARQTDSDSDRDTCTRKCGEMPFGNVRLHGTQTKYTRTNRHMDDRLSVHAESVESHAFLLWLFCWLIFIPSGWHNSFTKWEKKKMDTEHSWSAAARCRLTADAMQREHAHLASAALWRFNNVA